MLKTKIYQDYCIHPLTLRFPADQERDFLEDYTQKSLNQVRLGLALALTLYPLFGILDYLLIPDVKEKIWFIRYAIACPYLLRFLLFTWTRTVKRWSQPAMVLVALVLGFTIIAMTVIALSTRELLLLRWLDPRLDVAVHKWPPTLTLMAGSQLLPGGQAAVCRT